MSLGLQPNHALQRLQFIAISAYSRASSILLRSFSESSVVDPFCSVPSGVSLAYADHPYVLDNLIIEGIIRCSRVSFFWLFLALHSSQTRRTLSFFPPSHFPLLVYTSHFPSLIFLYLIKLVTNEFGSQ